VIERRTNGLASRGITYEAGVGFYILPLIMIFLLKFEYIPPQIICGEILIKDALKKIMVWYI
jgi:hypothetical protein